MDKTLRILFGIAAVAMLVMVALGLKRGHVSGLGLTVYVILPVAIAIYCAIACLARAELRANMTMMAISAVIGVYLLEIGLGLWPKNLRLLAVTAEEAAARRGQRFDTREAKEVLMDVRTTDSSAAIMVSPYVWLREERASGAPVFRLDDRPVFPLAGIGSAQTVFCNESGDWVLYRSDRFGFRNPDAVWDNEKLDVAFVGDSFTQGVCVEDGAVPASMVRSRFPRTVNLGQTGNGPLIMLATIREYLAVKRPRLVVWNFYEGNDFPSDLDWEAYNPILMKYLDTGYSQELTGKAGRLDALLRDYMNARLDHGPRQESVQPKETPIKDTLLLRRIRTLAAPVRRESPQYELLHQTLAEAIRTVHGWGGKMLFVYLPSNNRYLITDTGNPERDAVLGIARDLGLPIVDVHADGFARAARANDYFAFTGSHYNEAGYRVTGQLVMQAVQRMLVAE